MPNWCNNVVEISHVSKDMMARVIKAAQASGDEPGLLAEFFPCPEDLQIVAGSVGAKGSPEQEALELQEDINVKRYGFKNWYDWQVANWGTKWDICEASCTAADDGYAATLSFDTAWSPPIAAYEKLMELGFTIKAFYYEPGMCYAGVWEDGNDNFYEYGGMNSDAVAAEFPKELDEMFCISESMSEWEEENAEEE